MLQIILHISIISFICLVWGLPGYLLLRKKAGESYWFRDTQDIPVTIFFIGLLTISFLCSWLILIFPVKFHQLAIATGLLFLLMFFSQRKNISELFTNRRKSKIPISLLIFSVAVILLLILCGSLPTANDDTQLYHLQIIRWLNEYGTIPGTANIYPRLGLGSNWFNTISVFHIPKFRYQNFTFLNCTVTIWFFFWLVNRINYFRKDPSVNSRVLYYFNFLVLLYFLADWQLFRDTANSTSYDFIVTILIVFCLSYLLESVISEEYRKFSLIFMVLCISVATFKLSGIFILLPAFLYILRFKKFTLWLKLAGVFLLILSPVLIKNYMITGYPFFPATFIVGSPEWQLPREMTVTFRDYIFNANRFYNHQLHFIATYEKKRIKLDTFLVQRHYTPA